MLTLKMRQLRGATRQYNLSGLFAKLSHKIPVSGVSRARCIVSGTYRHFLNHRCQVAPRYTTNVNATGTFLLIKKIVVVNQVFR